MARRLPAGCLDDVPDLPAIQALTTNTTATRGDHWEEHATLGTIATDAVAAIRERAASASAADAGVNAPVLFFDPADGLMVTRFVDGAVTMSAERFRDLGAVARAGAAFRALHTTAQPFSNDFTLFPMIDEYKTLLASKGSDG
mgnify:CR=1 FL=1